MSAHQLGHPFGKPAEWVEARTGIRRLRRVRSAQELVGLACDAAAKALADAGVAAGLVDLVVVASCSSAQLAGRVVDRLGLRGVPVDLNAACSGFCYAVSAADAFIRSGAAEYVLVIGAENMSTMIDEGDLATSIVFGDGAGAAVLGPGSYGRTGVGPAVWGSDGDRAGLIEFDRPVGGFLRMRGQEVFRWAVDAVPGIARAACERAGVSLADIDVFVPHQANLRIIDAVARRLGLRADAVVASDVAESGNTSAASVPIALDKLRRAGSIQPGALGLLVGFGAGLAHAAQVVRLP